MKKLLLIAGLLWSAIASAQFTPGQLLTAAELNSQFALYAPLAGATYTGAVTVPTLSVTGSASIANLTATGTFTLPASTVLPNGVTATTQGFLDNSTKVDTTAFAKQTVLAATAEIPIANFTGGTYNFQSVGTNGQVVILASGGVVSSVAAIATPGSGYQVGDCLILVGGNGDAIIRVATLSGSGIATATVLYGGTGYTTGAQLFGTALPPGSRTANLVGTLTSNATIIIPAGTYLQGARRVGFANNTTGTFTTTVKLSNGSGGSTGTGVVIPQGTSNSTSLLLYTDGVTDVWPEVGYIPGYATLASPALSGVPTAPTAALATNTTQLATTAFVLANAVTSSSPTITTPNIIGVSSGSNAAAGSVGEYLTNSTSGTGLTNNVAANATSISLTAGDWDVSGVILFTAGATTVSTSYVAGVSSTSATIGSSGTYNQLNIPSLTGGGELLTTPTVRISVSSTSTVFLIADCTFTTSTMTVNGFIRARRVR